MAGLLTRQRKGDRADGSAAHPEGEPKKKLTRREREKRDKALRANLPSRADVSLNGIFELSGTVTFTHAVGNVPGGKFVCRHVVVQGHMMYLFEGTTRGSRPTAKPLMLLMLKRAVVTEIGVLELNPPLPPHAHVFRVEFPVRKQYGYRAFFFKCPTNLELKRWMRDLSWRVNASQVRPIFFCRVRPTRHFPCTFPCVSLCEESRGVCAYLRRATFHVVLKKKRHLLLHLSVPCVSHCHVSLSHLISKGLTRPVFPICHTPFSPYMTDSFPHLFLISRGGAREHFRHHARRGGRTAAERRDRYGRPSRRTLPRDERPLQAAPADGSGGDGGRTDPPDTLIHLTPRAIHTLATPSPHPRHTLPKRSPHPRHTVFTPCPHPIYPCPGGCGRRRR